MFDNDVKDASKFFDKKADQRNKQKVKSAIKRARDQQMREMIDMKDN